MSETSYGSDYTYLWWAHGYKGKSPEGKSIICIQTGNYGAAFDVKKASFTNFGIFANSKSFYDVLGQTNEDVFTLPTAELSWKIVKNGVEYKSTGASPKDDDTRIIDSGRYVQRFDVNKVAFRSNDGKSLNLTGRMEVAAQAESLSLILEITPEDNISDSSIAVECKINPEWKNVKKLNEDLGVYGAVLTDNKGNGVIITSPQLPVTSGSLDISGSTLQVSVSPVWAKGLNQYLSLTITPAFGITEEKINALLQPFDNKDISAVAILPEGERKLNVTHDRLRNWYTVDISRLPCLWNMESNPNGLERIKLETANNEHFNRRIMLMFSKGQYHSITGFSPMIRDEAGFPTGKHVQISKNWHSQSGESILYQGPWIHCYTSLELPSNSNQKYELSIAEGFWGGVPVVSHAQLSLIGWGGNQLWEEVAIGSNGESICYDPDVCLNRSMIDDVRPLMVWGMKSTEKDLLKWDWTNNVGGGDFLVYYNEKGIKQPLEAVKTYHSKNGPNLTDVTYAGTTGDGAIKAYITVSSPRCDDINRAYHKVRYEVLKDTKFKRLAFYQVGADKYNNHYFSTLAIGNTGGLVEEWKPGGQTGSYDRKGIECIGDAPWFSLHDAEPNKNTIIDKTWADRGLVIRSWEAKIGGEMVSNPYASVYRTNNQILSSNVELSPPSWVTELKAGDYIEFEVELLILPMTSDGYYGLNESFANDLKENANTWKMVWRQAKGNDINVNVTRGKLKDNYPIVIDAGSGKKVEFEITGGLGYLPVTFTNLTSYKAWKLEEYCGGESGMAEWEKIDQSVHGNDYWQADFNAEDKAWSITFNVLLDSSGDDTQTRRYRLSRES